MNGCMLMHYIYSIRSKLSGDHINYAFIWGQSFLAGSEVIICTAKLYFFSGFWLPEKSFAHKFFAMSLFSFAYWKILNFFQIHNLFEFYKGKIYVVVDFDFQL